MTAVRGSRRFVSPERPRCCRRQAFADGPPRAASRRPGGRWRLEQLPPGELRSRPRVRRRRAPRRAGDAGRSRSRSPALVYLERAWLAGCYSDAARRRGLGGARRARPDVTRPRSGSGCCPGGKPRARSVVCGGSRGQHRPPPASPQSSLGPTILTVYQSRAEAASPFGRFEPKASAPSAASGAEATPPSGRPS